MVFCISSLCTFTRCCSPSLPSPFASSSSPNQNPPVDAMVSTLAHELLETATDPFRNAWHSLDSGKEAGDLCTWQFGHTKTGSNAHGRGDSYEYNLAGRRGTRYLVQLAYDPVRQACALQSRAAAADVMATGSGGIASLF